MKEKVIFFLEKALLLELYIFLIIAPYFNSAIKICLGVSMLTFILLNIIQYNKGFLKGFIAKTVLNKSILIFFIAVVVSTLCSINFKHSQGFFFERYLLYIFFFILGAYIVKKRENISFLILSLIISAGIVGLGAIFDYFTVYSNIRAITSFGRGVFLTQYLTMVIPLLFAFTIFSKRILLSLASAVTFFLLTLFLIWNISRAAILSVIIAIFCIYFIKNRRNAIILLISILGLIIFLIFIYALPRFKSFDKFLDPALRPIRWESALRIVKDYPVFGSGLGTIELIYADYAPILKDKGPHVHNTFLEVAAEMGLVGLVAFMLIFIVLFKKFFNFVKGSTGTEDPDKFAFATGVFGGILATLVLSLSCTVITVGVNNATLFWFLLGALASIIA